MSQQPVIILGAGIAGLTLGRCLRQKGISSVIYDRGSTSPRHTYGITLQPWAYKPLLKALDMNEAAFKSRVGISRNKTSDSTSAPFRANRWKLESLLREGQTIHFEHPLSKAKLPDSEKNIRLMFENGQELQPSLVVDAMGVHSKLRRDLLPHIEPDIQPFAVYSGKRYVKTDVFSSVFAPAFGNSNVVTHEPRNPKDPRLEISVNDYGKHDKVSISYIFSRAAREGDDSLHRPERSNLSATEIPKELYDELENVVKGNNLDQAFKECFDVETVRSDRVLHWLMRIIQIPKEELLRLSQHGVVMIGDSAHALPILGGHGANLAISDAIKLADALENGVSSSQIETFYDANWQSWQDAVEDSKQELVEMHRVRSNPTPSL